MEEGIVRLPDRISADIFRAAANDAREGREVVTPLRAALARGLQPGDTIWLREVLFHRAEGFVRRTIADIVPLSSGIRVVYQKDGSHYWFEVGDDAQEAVAWVVKDGERLFALLARSRGAEESRA